MLSSLLFELGIDSFKPITMADVELSLVGKVEMKIALANSDLKLEYLLKIYLTPLLLKLSSSHEAVRLKVISICNHLNTRLKSS